MDWTPGTWVAGLGGEPKLEARVLNRTRQPPSDGSTHWSSRKLAKEFRISHVTVTQIWKRAGLKPHRIKRYMASNDPDFETKAADIIGLYLKPPKHAAIFSLDEKTAIQALDRLDPVLPLSPGRLERHGFEYYRHGTLSLYAALDTLSGEVYGKTATRHTSAEFVKFMEELVDRQPRRREIHVILDNLSAHKTAKVRAFLEAHPKVHLHFTPTYSSMAEPSRGTGFPRSSAMSSLAASSPQLAIYARNSCDTSVATTATQGRFAGPIRTLPGASRPLRVPRLQATSCHQGRFFHCPWGYRAGRGSRLIDF